MPADYVFDNDRWGCPDFGGSPGSQYGGRSHAAHRLSQLRTAGGFDHRSLAAGDWTGNNNASWAPVIDGNSYNNTGYRAIQGSYAYRNMAAVPATGAFGATSTDDDSNPYPGERNNSRFRMGFTRPTVIAEAGAPAFKTTRILGSRAIASDSFSKAPHSRGPQVPYAGQGRFAHGEGYHVLYGDGNVRWYGDPQLRIMWMPLTIRWGFASDFTFHLGYAGITAGTATRDAAVPLRRISDAFFGGSGNRRIPYYPPSAQHVWHSFDLAQGVDQGTTETEGVYDP